MNEKQSSYREIMKATSIFGGVQVFQIIISIIRSKFVAVLLGPIGLGISDLLSSTIGLIQSLTNFGLGTSAVRDISSAYSTGNANRIAVISTVFNRLVWITGILGSVITLVLSPWLSYLTFGNKDYTLPFALISFTLLLNQISTGQSVLLRGTRQIKYLAKAGIIGSVLGLLTTIPLYYIWGIKGIVPSIIVTSITTLLITWHYSRKIEIETVRVSKARTIVEGKGMIKLGFLISLNGLIVTGTSYIVRIFISNTGSIEDVGLYNAGFAIVSTYVGMVFTAMSIDYYPRLSSVASSDSACQSLMNQQSEIAVLIIAPIILIFLVFIKWLVILLYSVQFTPINDMILYAAFGMIFKAASWSIAFIFLAKGASKLFFWNELISNIYILALNIIGYQLYNLTGMGISFLIGYLLYLIQVYIVANVKYNFHFEASFVKIFFPQLILATVCLLSVKITPLPYNYIGGGVLIFLSVWLSLKNLDKRLGLIVLIKDIFKR